MSELEAHREELREEPGFLGMRITRSITTEGNVLLSVETQWTDSAHLSSYTLSQRNAASIIRGHEAELRPDTLQILRGEAIADEEARIGSVGERTLFAFLVPIGVPLIGLAIIYALSRIYLAVDSNVATTLAAIVAVGIIAVAGYVASNPKMPPWQLGTIVTGVLAIFAVGFIYAGIHGKNEEPHGPSTETAVAGTTPAGGGLAATISAKNVKFDQSSLNVAAGPNVTIRFDNQDTGVTHNFHIFRGSDANGESVGATTEAAGPDTQDLTVNLTEGAYFFRCDVHPTQMTGTLNVGPPAPGGGSPPPGGPATGGTPPPAPAGETLSVVAKNVKFDQSTLDAKAGSVAIEFDNQDNGVSHNFHLYKGNDATGESVGNTEIAAGPDKQTLTVNLTPGSYYYDCEVHPTQMTGKMQVSGP